jgi:hypothetical protein
MPSSLAPLAQPFLEPRQSLDPTEEGTMKFRATVVFEFNASSIVDAGHKVDDAVKHAGEESDMDAKSIDLVTPPGSAPVTIPPPAAG